MLSEDIIRSDGTVGPIGQRFEDAIDGAVGGGHSTMDLGTVNIVDLLNGPQTLYTPTGPLWVVKVAVDRASVVLPDSQGLLVVQGSTPFTSDPDTPLFFINVNTDRPSGTVTGWVQDEPILAGISTEQSGYFLDEALGSWQADQAYDTAKECILESGHIWSSSVGTTGGSKPDFAGSPTEGSTVADNTVTWTNEGPIPTVGSAHFYALVA